MKVKVLFVCMGNICRSPTAQGVFEQLVETHGLSELVLVDSAGTHAYHVGEQPDQRAAQAAATRSAWRQNSGARIENGRFWTDLPSWGFRSATRVP